MFAWFLLCFVIGVGSNPLNDTLYIIGGDSSGPSSISSKVVYNAMAFSQIFVKYQNDHDQNLYNVGVYLDPNSAGYGRFDAAKLPEDQINNNLVSSIICKGMEILSEGYCNKYNMSTKQFVKLLMQKKYRISGICTDTSKSDKNKTSDETILKYRTLDGSYNNLKYPYWGQANNIFPRLMDPDYADGISAPRASKSGKDLLSSRIISVKAFPDIVFPDNTLSMAASEMTQVISHDMTLQVMDNDLNTGPISCCTHSETCALPKILQHKSCYPVEVSQYDPFFSQYKIGCLNFVRSIAAPNSDCTLSWREQVNTVTGYLDASIVYGSSKSRNAGIRTFKGGLLTESPSGDRHMPSCNANPNSTDYCYKAGDDRVNQQVHLASTQTLYLREHNRLAKLLQKLNSKWSDEKLFQEARRILIAEHQHIVYNELLPLLFGKNFSLEIQTKTDKNGFTSFYDETLNGATHNDFTIAYRILHSIIPEDIRLCDEARKILSKHKFSDMIGNVSLMETSPHGFDDVVRGMAYSQMMLSDHRVTSEITNKVFKGKNPFGSDLMMMDIQRGRDHGVPGYNDYRAMCGLSKVSTFDQLGTTMESSKIQVLKDLYDHPDDIDLVVGGMYETPTTDSKFGPVINCILKQQFYRTMVGDRFFYTNKNQKYPFTTNQLKEIKKVTFAGLVCKNSDKIVKMPPKAFVTENNTNQRISCDKIPDLDITQWKE